MIAEHVAMRTIHTFVLRLLVDSDDPRALRGAIHAVASDEELTFADEAALLARLRQLAAAMEAGPPQDRANGIDPSP